MSRHDVVIVGGGHNGLVAAAYLARAGRSVLLLERRGELGGAAVSARVFPGQDARLSRYAYLVSLLPQAIVRELGLPIELRRRRFSSYTPVGDGGRLIATGESPSADWAELEKQCAHIAARVFPTLTEPLRTRAQMRAHIDDDAAWETLFERPLGEAIEAASSDDIERGIVLTDALIGTFAGAHDSTLLQNRCFLYHVIGNGTGDWDVPVGGMGAVSHALATAARDAGAELVTGAEATAIDPDGEVRWRDERGEERTAAFEHVLVGAAPATLAELLGAPAPEPKPEGAQLKVNMLVSRLPRLRDGSVAPEDAFAGTFHVHESYAELARARQQAAAGRIPELPPCELYCHTLADRSILGPELRATDAQTLTLFGLHMPARLFESDNESARGEAYRLTLAALNDVLAEPIEDVLIAAEVRTPVDLEHDLGLPGGHIFHGDLQWPFVEDDAQAGTWGVETAHPRVLLCGAGARRGGGVSGIPGYNAAQAVLAPRAAPALRG